MKGCGFNCMFILIGPSRKPLSYRLLEETSGNFILEFTPSEVGTHLVEVLIAGRRLSVAAKVYNASLIHVLDVAPGVVGQTTQFKGRSCSYKMKLKA